MSLTIDNILLIGSILLFGSLVVSRTTKYGIPTLLLFLFVGMLAGSDGVGGISFDNPVIAKFIGAVALSFILFSGGLETKFTDIKPVLWQGISLSTLGVIITAFIIGMLVHLITDFTILEGLLLGSIVSSTDAAAVFSILKSKSIGLKGNLRPLLELESGSNDPMAFFLTIVFTYLLSEPDATYGSLIPMFFSEMILGAVVGFAMGHAMYRTINWIKLEFDGLYSVLLISMVLFVYSFSDFIGANPFLAIYISACVLGNKDFIHKKSLTKHFDGVSWMAQIVMFLTLGLLVFPSEIIPYMGIGFIISILLILVARPVSVFISMAMFRIGFRKKLFISWVGLRGAVPIVLATYPLSADVGKAGIIFNIVFFISVTSVLIQGTTIPVVSRWLNCDLPASVKRKSVLDLEQSWKAKTIFNVVPVEPGFKAAGKSVVDLGLPSSIIIALVERNGKFYISDGATRILPGDRLYIMADDKKAMDRFHECVGPDILPEHSS
ncbi:MAG: potassium/proton antiporter [Bacteroidales bacterium]